jgi:predicted tellurium resistance membrane protein TerC
VTNESYPCNIGPQQRKRRMNVGIGLVVIFTITSFLSKSFVSQALAFFGFLAIFQAAAGTCVFLAASNDQNMDDGRRSVDDPKLIEFFQKQSKTIYTKTFLATLALILISRGYHILKERFL